LRESGDEGKSANVVGKKEGEPTYFKEEFCPKKSSNANRGERIIHKADERCFLTPSLHERLTEHQGDE